MSETDISYTITDQSGEVLSTVVFEGNVEEPSSSSSLDVVQIVDYICNNCGKQYKGLKCMQKHFAQCGQPANNKLKPLRKKRQQKRDHNESSSSKATTTTEEDSSSPLKREKKYDASYEISDDTSEELPVVDVVPASETDEDSDHKMCFCCEEPLKNAHVRIIVDFGN